MVFVPVHIITFTMSTNKPKYTATPKEIKGRKKRKLEDIKVVASLITMRAGEIKFIHPQETKQLEKLRIAFVDKAIEKRGNVYDYSRVIYVNMNTEIEIICGSHGSSLEKPSSHLRIGLGCKKCDHDFKIKTWIEKATENHKGKYDYSMVPSTWVAVREKCTIICKIHGAFPQSPDLHLRMRGCRPCGRISATAKTTKGTEKFIEDAKKVHGDKFCYDSSVYVNAKTDVTIRCVKHDLEFQQAPDKHLSSKYCCNQCEGESKQRNDFFSREDHIKRFNELHNFKYEYDKFVYTGSADDIIINCKVHGDFTQKYKYHLAGNGCQKCGQTAPRTYDDVLQELQELFVEEKYDFSKFEFKRMCDNVTLGCFKHGDFHRQPDLMIYYKSACQKCSREQMYERNTLTAEEYISRVKKVHGNKLVYDDTKYVNAKTEISFVCPLHGKMSQLPSGHLKTGCTKCSHEESKWTTETFVTAAKLVHSGYDYSKTRYTLNDEPVTVTCLKPEHGDFTCIPVRHLHYGVGCPKCNMCPSCLLWRTYGKLCEFCKPDSKHRLKTKEMKVVNFLREKLPDRVAIHNRSVGKDCTDGHLFPDIRIDCGYYYLIIEVDENCHKSSSYKCDEQRMYDIIAKLGLPVAFIRYNPDSPDSNLQELLKVTNKYLESENILDECDDYGFLCTYLFYD